MRQLLTPKLPYTGWCGCILLRRIAVRPLNHVLYGRAFDAGHFAEWKKARSYAGFRLGDAVYLLREVFGQSTQARLAFHNAGETPDTVEAHFIHRVQHLVLSTQRHDVTRFPMEQRTFDAAFIGVQPGHYLRLQNRGTPSLALAVPPYIGVLVVEQLRLEKLVPLFHPGAVGAFLGADALIHGKVFGLGQNPFDHGNDFEFLGAEPRFHRWKPAFLRRQVQKRRVADGPQHYQLTAKQPGVDFLDEAIGDR